MSDGFSCAIVDDDSQLPIEEEDEFDNTSMTDVCLVYTSQLEALLRAKCLADDCNSPIEQIAWVRHGSCYTANMECFRAHCNSWSSQPKVTDITSDTMYRGNLDLTTATLAAGLAYADIQRLAEVLDLAIASQTTFFEHQSQYVIPAVDDIYNQHMVQVHEILAEQEEEAAKTKVCAEIQPWLRSILKHLWFSVDNCSKDPIRCQELFRSIIHHVANEHSWKEDQSFTLVSDCCHAQLSAEKVATTGWLSKQSDAYRRLCGILTDKRLLKNVGRIAKNLTTSAVENYHSVRLTYATKRKAYCYTSYRMRSQLAVLHHNFASLGKEQATTAAGAVKRKIAYSKVGGRWTEKTKHIRPTVEWKRGLLVDVRVERHNFLTMHINRTLMFPNIPANAAPLPRPTDERMEELLNSGSDVSEISESDSDL
uniref:Uncharacterized protein n=1 Tax=Plectus sambesii TaxID=2011161 RepID=A0A914WSW2_9BILA